jgi:putative ABC transport system permease protein
LFDPRLTPGIIRAVRGPIPIPSDLRHAIRALVAGRQFSTVAIGCLALAIATNTTMFSVFDAMFLRPLPFKDAARLVTMSGRAVASGRRVALTLDDVRELRDTVKSLDVVAAYSGRAATLVDGGEPERVSTQLVTATFLALLGQQPQIGRAFAEDDDRTTAAPVALISDSLWRRRYGAEPSIVGRAVRLDGAPWTIVGVMPAKFRFPSRTDIWIPTAPALGASSGTRAVSVAGRLAPAATTAALNAELGARVLQARGQQASRTVLARPFAATGIGSEERTIVGALMGATTLLLVLACVNLANLMLARGAGRRREIAIRASLGASRGRIVRQLLTEAMLLALAAGTLALPLAWYGITWVRDAVPPTDPLGPYYIQWSLDARTFVYAVTVSLVTGIAFGLVPAYDAAGRRLSNPLREGAGSASGRVQRRVHSALIVAQVSLALVLLAGASLFVRTYAGLRTVRLGYDTSHLMTLRFFLAGAAYDGVEARVRAVGDIAAQLEELPGALASTVTDLVPLDDQGGSDSPAAVEGRAFQESDAATVTFAGVAGRWVDTFGVPLVAGRTFHHDELANKAPVALVNVKLAETFWPGENPIGRRFRLADEENNPWLTVVGVVPNIRTVKLDERGIMPPTAYLPYPFVPARNYGIVVRTQGDPPSVAGAVRAAVHAVDPEVALFDVYPMEQVRWLSYWMYVMWGTMFAVFGGMALVIAAVGVYGVVFYTVARRTREIGLRVALGARRAQVVAPMLRQAALLAAAGLVIGLFGASFVTPVVGSLLIGVPPIDPAGLTAVSAALAAVALTATWFPAWRASAVDPMVALREE